MAADQPHAPPRWMYRFENYRRAFSLLREAIETLEARELTQLEKEGVIQRFEYCWELAWKSLKDYLEYSGVVLVQVTPASVIRSAFEAKIIADADSWMKALDARNKMSHVYDFEKFEQVIKDIQGGYLRLFDDLQMFLMEEMMQHPIALPRRKDDT